jgi:hypothetical protein
MDQYLQSLEKLKDLPIVRFFSRFFSEDRLSSLLSDLNAGLERSTPSALAKELLIWAVVLALVTFAIDQAFYWTKPGQLDRARDTWQSLSAGAVSFGRGVKSLALRARELVTGRRGASRGRR